MASNVNLQHAGKTRCHRLRRDGFAFSSNLYQRAYSPLQNGRSFTSFDNRKNLADTLPPEVLLGGYPGISLRYCIFMSSSSYQKVERVVGLTISNNLKSSTPLAPSSQKFRKFSFLQTERGQTRAAVVAPPWLTHIFMHIFTSS